MFLLVVARSEPASSAPRLDGACGRSGGRRTTCGLYSGPGWRLADSPPRLTLCYISQLPNTLFARQHSATRTHSDAARRNASTLARLLAAVSATCALPVATCMHPACTLRARDRRLPMPPAARRRQTRPCSRAHAALVSRPVRAATASVAVAVDVAAAPAYARHPHKYLNPHIPTPTLPPPPASALAAAEVVLPERVPQCRRRRRRRRRRPLLSSSAVR